MFFMSLMITVITEYKHDDTQMQQETWQLGTSHVVA